MPKAQPQPYSSLQRKEAPDGLLVEQALAGDQYAFELLANRYHHQLVSYIRGFLKDNDQIYDVLQHVYLQLYLSLPILLRREKGVQAHGCTFDNYLTKTTSHRD